MKRNEIIHETKNYWYLNLLVELVQATWEGKVKDYKK